MDYFVTKENYTNRGHWARARHVSEVSFSKKIFGRRPREIYSSFDIIIAVVQNNNNNNNNIPKRRRRRRRAHARMRVCALVHWHQSVRHVCTRSVAVARVYGGGGGVPDPVTLVTAVYGNRHRFPGDVAAPCALKSETPRPRWRFSRRARVPPSRPVDGGGARYTRAPPAAAVYYSDGARRTVSRRCPVPGRVAWQGNKHAAPPSLLRRLGPAV